MRHNWEYKKLGDVCDKGSSNISLNKIEDNTGKYALFGASGYVKGIDFYHNETPYIGIVKDGSGCGRVNIYPAKSSLVGTMQYIYPKPNCNLKFLMYLLQKMDLSSLVSGSAIPHIYFKDYSKYIIPVPPLSTQQSIVSELDTLSGIIAECKETLKDYDALEQSIFYDMFGDPVKNEKGWEVKKLGECFKVTSSKRIYMEELTDCGIPFLKVADINNLINEKCTPTSFISNDKYQELKSNGHVPSPNDLLVTARGTIGKVYIIQENDAFYFQDGMITWLKQGRYKIEPKYIKDLFQVPNFLEYLGQFSNNSTVAFLSIAKLATVNIPIPPLPLQQSFATKIEAIEQMKAETREALQEAETLLQARMDYWFN